MDAVVFLSQESLIVYQGPVDASTFRHIQEDCIARNLIVLIPHHRIADEGCQRIVMIVVQRIAYSLKIVAEIAHVVETNHEVDRIDVGGIDKINGIGQYGIPHYKRIAFQLYAAIQIAGVGTQGVGMQIERILFRKLHCQSLPGNGHHLWRIHIVGIVAADAQRLYRIVGNKIAPRLSVTCFSVVEQSIGSCESAR